MMDWTGLLQHYGYLAVFVGTIFEGETVLILATYAVHQHIFHFWMLIAVATLVGFIGDQLYYQIGYRYGAAFIEKRPKLQQKFDQASVFIEHYPRLTILLMRFAWGLRTILPMSIGIRRFPRIEYMLINFIASSIWAFVVVSVGIQISHYLHRLWDWLWPYRPELYSIVAVIASVVLLSMFAKLIKFLSNKNYL